MLMLVSMWLAVVGNNAWYLDGGSTFVGEEEFLLIDSNSACSG
jgi:hypothetical protein